MEFPLWCNGIGSGLGVLGCGFDPRPGTGASPVSLRWFAAVAWICSLAWELHMLWGGQKKKKKKERVISVPAVICYY